MTARSAHPPAGGHTPRGYVVNVYDRAGEFDSTACDDFMEANSVYVRRRNEYPGKVVLVFNLDRCDVDTDGLTEEETEALS